jgi:hypothetical protein
MDGADEHVEGVLEHERRDEREGVAVVDPFRLEAEEERDAVGVEGA